MLDDEESDDTFHGTRESYSYLSDVEWSAVERMSSTVGEEAVWSLLSSRDKDQQHSIIAKFLQRELDASRAEVTMLHQQGHQQTELMRQQQSQSAAAASTRERRRETLKLEVSKYRGVEEDSLMRWFLEVDDAIKARHIEDEQMQVAFAKSNLTGRAKTWALNQQLQDPNVFGSLAVFKTMLSQTFEPPRAEFRTLTELLKIKQGKRDVHAYAQHIRYLASCMVANPMPEFALITIFLQGLSDGPVRNHLFRVELSSLEEAIATAVQEDFSVRQAHTSLASYRPPRRVEAGGPEPMDLCRVESEKPRFPNNKRSQRCNRCQKLGHYAYECSAPRPASKNAERSDRPFAKKGNGRGSDAVAKPQQRSGSSKNDRGQ